MDEFDAGVTHERKRFIEVFERLGADGASLRLALNIMGLPVRFPDEPYRTVPGFAVGIMSERTRIVHILEKYLSTGDDVTRTIDKIRNEA